jgi:hypothetical protein
VCPSSLDSKEHVLLPLWSFQGARGLCDQRAEPTRRPARPPGRRLPYRQSGLSKLNSVNVELDVVLGEPASRTASEEAIDELRRLRSISSDFPRKEVIQPHLPVRLPCYDFTPIINPTFDGCLPEGLAHRLRVLPTFVV